MEMASYTCTVVFVFAPQIGSFSFGRGKKMYLVRDNNAEVFVMLTKR